VFPLRYATAQLRSTNRQFAQCYRILAHFQHSKFNTVYIYIYRIALLTLGTLQCLCVCMIAQCRIFLEGTLLTHQIEIYPNVWGLRKYGKYETYKLRFYPLL